MGNADLMMELQKQVTETFERYNEGLLSEEETMDTIKEMVDIVHNSVERLYMRFWGEGYHEKDPDTVHIHELDRNTGYEIDDLYKLAALVVGEAVTFNVMGAVHSVVRIK